MAKKKPAPARPAPAEEVAACPRCGSTNITFATSKNISCGECGYLGAPAAFRSGAEWQEFRDERELARMRETKLWAQKVFHRTIPVVVLVNWVTALYFFIFFTFGMMGWFRSEWFQWAFLYLSVAVVALGFGAIVRWGKERISL